jgi:hypothetical protein
MPDLAGLPAMICGPAGDEVPKAELTATTVVAIHDCSSGKATWRRSEPHGGTVVAGISGWRYPATT